MSNDIRPGDHTLTVDIEDEGALNESANTSIQEATFDINEAYPWSGNGQPPVRTVKVEVRLFLLNDPKSDLKHGTTQRYREVTLTNVPVSNYTGVKNMLVGEDDSGPVVTMAEELRQEAVADGFTGRQWTRLTVAPVVA